MADFPERTKLIEHLSPFTQSFGEIQEIMKVEEKWMDKLEIEIGKVFDNAFIEDCDEYGISKYENFLGIIPDSKEELDSRKSRVLARWNNAVPYTYRVLIRQLNSYCGVNNYDIDADLQNYSISIGIYGRDDITEVQLLLDRILPLNIVYDARSAKSMKGINNIGTVWQDDEIFTLRQVVI